MSQECLYQLVTNGVSPPRNPPQSRAGKPLTFDLHGPAGAAWVLAGAIGTGHLALPYGTFRLDPQTAVTVGAGILDARGHAARTFSVPSSPSLIGLTAYWQAALAPPLSLTNLESTMITGL